MDTKMLQAEYAALAQQLKFGRYEEETDESLRAHYRMSEIEKIWAKQDAPFRDANPLPCPPLVLPIPLINMADLEHEVAKLNKRAVKLGCPQIVLVKGPEGLESYTQPLTAEEVAMVNEAASEGRHLEIKPRIVRAKAQLVEMVGEAPKLDGWELIGVLEKLPTGQNIFRAAPDKVIPETYRDSGKHCDHCKTSRQRKDVVLVRHVTTGEYKQVGRQCVRDFFNGHDPSALLFHAEMFFKLERFAHCGGVPSEEQYSISLMSFLAHVALEVRRTGVYVTKAEAQFGEVQPTSSAALLNMGRNSPDAGVTARAGYVAPSAEDDTTAQNTIAWIRGMEKPEGDFMTNLKVLFDMDWINYKNTGIAAWAVKGYLKDVEKQAVERARMRAGANADYIGTIGKREVFELRYMSNARFSSDFGVMVILKFLDDRGNIVVWKTSEGSNYPDFEVGAKYSVKATVKKHEEYKGVKQTKISRAVIGEKLAGPELKQETA